MPPQDLMSVVKQTKYPLGAFMFIQRGLDFTVRRIHGEIEPDFSPGAEAAAAGGEGDEVEAIDPEELGPQEFAEPADDLESTDEPSRHVSGQQLCEGLRDFAIHEYGLLARTVLRRWKITSCEDFGNIVFAMVDGGLMHKTDDDTIQDFANCFSFASAFDEPLSLSEN